MTVQSNDSRVVYDGNGSVTEFAYDFYILDETHLEVSLTNETTGLVTIQVLNTDYTVSGVGVQNGGNVTFVVAPGADKKVTIRRDTPLDQLTDYNDYDAFPASSHETALDKLTMIDQQQSEEIARSIKLPVSTSLTSITFPDGGSTNANKFIAWNNDGSALTAVVGNGGGGGGGLSAVSDDPNPTLGGDLVSNSKNIKMKSGLSQLIDQDTSNVFLSFSNTASAVNFWELVNSTTGNGPIFRASGSDSNIDVRIRSKGTGSIKLEGSGGEVILLGSSTSTAVNYVQIDNSISGVYPKIKAEGSDSTVLLQYQYKGASAYHRFFNHSTETIFRIDGPSSSVNYNWFTASTTGNNPKWEVLGTDANIAAEVQFKGNAWFGVKGTSSASGRVRLYEDTDNGTNYTQIAASSSVTGNYTLTLPGAAPSTDQYLRFDTSGNGSWQTVTVPTAAVQADMEADNETTKFVTSNTMKFGRGVAKATAAYNGSTNSFASGTNYIASSITDNGTGDHTINLSTSIGAAPAVPLSAINSLYAYINTTVSATAVRISTKSDGGTLTDSGWTSLACYGDYA
jgi:hypothetical protein